MPTLPAPTFRTARRLAYRLDRLPFAPAVVADALLDRHLDRRRRRAAGNAEWAAIEARRHVDGRPGVVFLSDDLSLEDWERQLEIAAELTPAPVWAPAVGVLGRVRAVPAVYVVARALQRARRGWADSDAWNLGWHLCRTLGEQLLYLSRHAEGWPGDEEFPTFDDWTEALARHGSVLVARDEDDTNLEAVRESLHWVADHVTHLWD